jgi:hypothetical protein
MDALIKEEEYVLSQFSNLSTISFETNSLSLDLVVVQILSCYWIFF